MFTKLRESINVIFARKSKFNEILGVCTKQALTKGTLFISNKHKITKIKATPKKEIL